MCAADLICKPESMHGYEGVQLISLRKEGRGRGLGEHVFAVEGLRMALAMQV